MASATELALAFEKPAEEPLGPPTTLSASWPLRPSPSVEEPLARPAAAAAEDFAKRFAQLDGAALAGALAVDSGTLESASAGATTSTGAVSCDAVSVATSPFAGLSARAGLESLKPPLGRAGTAGTGWALDRAVDLAPAVGVALAAVLVRERCGMELGVVGVEGTGSAD